MARPHTFTEAGAQRIVNAVRRVEGMNFDGRTPPQPKPRPVGQGGFTQWVSVTAPATATDGRYAATWSSYDVETDTWTEEGDCWLVERNGEALSAKGYHSRLQGKLAADGLPVFVTIIGSASSGTGDETSVAFPGTGRDYFTLPSGGAFTYGRFRDSAGVIDDALFPAMENPDLVLARGTSSLLSVNTYYMWPFVAQRDTIRHIVMPVTRVGTSTSIRIGIYTDLHTQAAGGTHYPGTLVDEVVTGTDLAWYEADPVAGGDWGSAYTTEQISIAVTAGDMYWMCFCYDYVTTSPAPLFTGTNALRAIYGYISRSLTSSPNGTNLVARVGLYYASGGVTVPGSAFPNPFTGSAAVPPAGMTNLFAGGEIDILAKEIVPAVLVGYGP